MSTLATVGKSNLVSHPSLTLRGWTMKVPCILSCLIMQLCNRWNPGSIWPVKAINGALVTRCIKDRMYRKNSDTQTEGPAPPPQRSSNRPPHGVNEIYVTKVIKLACRFSLFTLRPRIFCQFLFQVFGELKRCPLWGVIQTAPRVTQAAEGNCSRAERTFAALQTPHTPRPLKSDDD